jgi:hypothetical protein
VTEELEVGRLISTSKGLHGAHCFWFGRTCTDRRSEWRIDRSPLSRYSEEAEALGFNGIFERVLAAQAGFGDDAQAYRAAMSSPDAVQKASALEE